jgi:hypothetical protein
MARAKESGPGLPRRWAVRYSGGPLIGPGWLVLDGRTLALEPRAGQPNPRAPLPLALAGQVQHLGTDIVAFHARALPSSMNGSILLRAAGRSYVVYIPWFDIRNDLMPALIQAGFTTSVHQRWLGLGRDTAALTAPTKT